MKRRRFEERVPYPVDTRGFPLPPEEVDDRFIDNGRYTERNNHHLNYYARLFGSTAISHTFRSLHSQQLMMPIKSHNLLHDLYSGIGLPPADNMLEEIEYQKFLGTQLRYRVPELDGYVSSNISDVHIKTLKAEYNSIGRL